MIQIKARCPGDCIHRSVRELNFFSGRKTLAWYKTLTWETAHQAFRRYGIAVAAIAVAFAVRLALEPVLRDHAPYLFFLPALLVAAGFGGFGPGMVATGLSVPLVLYFISQFGELGSHAMLNGVAFFAIGLGIATLGEWLQRSRRRAAEREAHLRSILETVPAAMIVIDEGGVVQSWSRTAERLFGYSAEETVGQNVRMLMPSPYREEHDGFIKRYRETGERRMIGTDCTAAGRRKDGSIFPVKLVVGEMKSGNRHFFTGFVHDLTGQQQAEARLNELRSELIHVSRLTAMGEMASAIAHELNQPLSAIVNYVKGSLRLLHGSADESSAATRDAMERAAEQALRAGQIIRRLRNFVARGESEKQVESATKLVQEAAALAAVGAGEKGVIVTFKFDPRIDLVIADKLQIQQVLVNLIRNAIDAMEQSEKKVLTISTAAAESDMVAIGVDDTGTGISKEMSEKLFQPFVTTKRDGMGVGLSISRAIVEAHGGRIDASPRPDGGTRFCFTLQAAVEGHEVSAPGAMRL